MKRVMFGVLGTGFAAVALFFAYYCVRLAVVWMRPHDRVPATGQYIGAVAFPIAVLVFSWLARASFRRTKV